MDTAEFSRISSLYSQGKITTDQFRSAVSRFREASYSYEDSPMAKYYQNLSESLSTKAKKDEQKRLQLSKQMEEVYTTQQQKYSQYQQAVNYANSLMETNPQTARNLLRSAERQYAQEILFQDVLYDGSTKRSLSDVVAKSRSRRGNLVTPFGQLAYDLAPLQMDYEDYSKRSEEALQKYNATVEQERKRGEERFTKLKTELLGSAEQLAGPRERVYTERPL
jgi:chromosome segregation ATPase